MHFSQDLLQERVGNKKQNSLPKKKRLKAWNPAGAETLWPTSPATNIA
jgi:hypothetical protein